MSDGLAEIKEDTAEKVRRNLVVFATGILAMALLDAAIEGRFFGVAEVKNVKPWKAWLCVIAVLLYLRTRYMLSRAVAQYSDNFFEKREASTEQSLSQSVVDALRSTLQKKPTRSIKFDIPAPKSPEHRLLIGDVTKVHWNWTREGSVLATWKVPKSNSEVGVIQSEPVRIDFAISRLHHFKHQLSAWLHAHNISWDVLEYRLPILLANAALCCSIYKFALAAFGWPSLVDILLTATVAGFQWALFGIFDFVFDCLNWLAPYAQAVREWASTIVQ